MTTDELFDALAFAMDRNDAATTEAILDALEDLLPPSELADRLEALLLATDPKPAPLTLCA